MGLISVLAFGLGSPFAPYALGDGDGCVRDRTNWTADDGHWFVCENWDNGCPDVCKDAYVNNGGHVHIQGRVASARSLTIGSGPNDKGIVSVEAGGQLRLPQDNERFIVLHPHRGSIYVGYLGEGILNINNGGTVVSDIGYIATPVGTSLNEPEALKSKGSVTLGGANSTWSISNIDFEAATGLLIGGTSSGSDAGVGSLALKDGATVRVDSLDPSTQYSFVVGISGTLTGSGTVVTRVAGAPHQVSVFGTLAPTGTLTIDGTLSLQNSATTISNVTEHAADRVNIVNNMFLRGRLVALMLDGPYTAGAQFTLLHSDGARFNRFRSESIVYQGSRPPFTAVINYGPDGGGGPSDVFLYLKPH
jgi:hypothetical protein